MTFDSTGEAGQTRKERGSWARQTVSPACLLRQSFELPSCCSTHLPSFSQSIPFMFSASCASHRATHCRRDAAEESYIPNREAGIPEVRESQGSARSGSGRARSGSIRGFPKVSCHAADSSRHGSDMLAQWRKGVSALSPWRAQRHS